MNKKILLIPFIKKDDKILYFVGKRPKKKIPKRAGTDTLWAFPTGKVADNIKDETVVEGALRELQEELGVERYKNFINNHYEFRWNDEEEKNIEFVFAVELIDETIKLQKSEFSDYEFLEKEACSKRLFYKTHMAFLEILESDIKNRKYPKIFVFCGPGGSGKGSLMDGVRAKTNLRRAKTVTSRERGVSDSDEGRIFVSVEEFKKMEKNGDFIETNFFKDNYYGSPRRELESIIANGTSAIIELDLNGLQEIKKIYSNVVSFFIYCDLKTLKDRMTARGRDTSEEIEKRLKISAKELENSKMCDHVVRNHDGKLDETIEKIVKIIKKEEGQKK